MLLVAKVLFYEVDNWISVIRKECNYAYCKRPLRNRMDGNEEKDKDWEGIEVLESLTLEEKKDRQVNNEVGQKQKLFKVWWLKYLFLGLLYACLLFLIYPIIASGSKTKLRLFPFKFYQIVPKPIILKVQFIRTTMAEARSESDHKRLTVRPVPQLVKGLNVVTLQSY